MNKKIIGTLFGVIAGIIDVIPMVIQNLTWDANISAFTMWVVIGFFIASIELNINPILKGILISFLVLLPSAFIIGWAEPGSLIPIALMTTILGGVLGYVIGKIK
ncbi:MAG: hypothetical protein MUP82_01490 [Candidatus Marinimicrobia bacterium]|nr:hypothetical protein [Candidatus Neomarinimicrobiota bacterium]